MSVASWFQGVWAAARFRLDPYPEDNRVPLPGSTAAGVYVTPDLALKNAVVWACHRYLTQTVAQLPVRVMQDTGDRTQRPARHPVENVFTWRANPELAPFQFKETMVGWALLHGNGYAEIERDAANRVVAMWPIHPSRVTVARDKASGALVYEVDNFGQSKTVLAALDVFHLRGFGDGPVGLSVVEYAAETIGWAEAARVFGAAFFGNGLNPAGVIEGGPTDPDAVRRLRAQLDAMHKGPRKSNKWAILPALAKMVKLSVEPNDAQMIETMQFQVEEICRWFGVPPHKAQHLLRSTFSNIENQSIEVVVDSITPWCIRFEEEANFKLFGQNRSGFFIKLDLKGLLRGDFKSRQEGLAIQRRNGIINGDYWADLEDMPKPLDGTGKKYICEGNMTTMEQVGEARVAPTPPAAPTPPPEAIAALARIQTLTASLQARLRDAA